jgi:hypothetical protein
MSKLARVTITVPADLLASADARARRLDRSRSWVVAEALRGYLATAAVREPATIAYGPSPGLGTYRLQQLQADLALTPEQRVREAERTAREAALVRGTPRGRGLRFFDRYEDYLEWKRREGI